MIKGQGSLSFVDSTEMHQPDAICIQQPSELVRPIHYLGSKLRIVGLIREMIDMVDPSGGAVCDLFAGSGTVSREISAFRKVISVDIQEYSRVICSALLSPPIIDENAVSEFIEKAFESDQASGLKWAIEPIVTYETACINQAAKGEPEPLCEFLEQASIILFQLHPESFNKGRLRSVLTAVTSRLADVGLLNNVMSMTARYFGGIYFSYSQAAQIDMLLAALTTVSESERDTFLAAVLSTASDTVNTVGKQFAQPIRPRCSDGSPKKRLSEMISRDRTIDVGHRFKKWMERYLSICPPRFKHRVIRSDFSDVLDSLRGEVSVIYADPPYTRDHYSRYYHVLETVCLRDCPSVSAVRLNGSDRLSRGMYRNDRHQSPFCIVSKAPHAFAALFEKVRRLGVPLVLSYSPYERSTGARPRVMTMGDITEIARKSFKSVEVLSAGNIAHNKLNRSDVNKNVSYGAEKFIVCKP